MATILPFAFVLLCLGFLLAGWRLAFGPALRDSRDTADLRAYLAWKPAEIDRT